MDTTDFPAQTKANVTWVQSDGSVDRVQLFHAAFKGDIGALTQMVRNAATEGKENLDDLIWARPRLIDAIRKLTKQVQAGATSLKAAWAYVDDFESLPVHAHTV